MHELKTQLETKIQNMFAVMSNNYSTITLTHEHVENALSKYLNWSRRARLNKTIQ